jgi:hypothetical protein
VDNPCFGVDPSYRVVEWPLSPLSDHFAHTRFAVRARETFVYTSLARLLVAITADLRAAISGAQSDVLRKTYLGREAIVAGSPQLYRLAIAAQDWRGRR